MEIEVKVRKNRNEEELAKRIARIVAHDDTCCQKKENGWALDYRGNDWFMTGIEDVEGQKYGIVKVDYRYGNGLNKKMMEALQVFLQWEVGWNED